MIMKIIVLLALCAFVAAAKEEITYSEEEMELFKQLMKPQVEAEKEKIAEFQASELTHPTRPCDINKRNQCPGNQVCLNAPAILMDALTPLGYRSFFEPLRVSMGIEGAFCGDNSTDVLKGMGAAELVFGERYMQLMDVVNATLDQNNMNHLEFVGKIDIQRVLSTPRKKYIDSSRQRNKRDLFGGSGGDNGILNLIFLMTILDPSGGDDEGLLGGDMILYLLLLGGGGLDSGLGGNLFSSPLLLIILLFPDFLGTDGSGSGDGGPGILLIILLMSVFGQDESGLGGGLGGISPIFLLMSGILGGDEEGAMTDILPLLFLLGNGGGLGGIGGGLGGIGGGEGGIESLLPLLLLSGFGSGTGDSLESFMIMILLFGGLGDSAGGFGGGFGGDSILPLVLLMSSQENGAMGSNNIVFLLVMLSLFSGGNTDLNSILPLILLMNDGGLGGVGESNSDMMLLMLLVLGGGSGLCAGGDISSLVSIMVFQSLFTDGDFEIEDMFLLLALSGGLGGTGGGGLLGSFLPLLLFGGDGNDDDSSNTIMILFVLLFAGGNGCGTVTDEGYYKTTPVQVNSDVSGLPASGNPNPGVFGGSAFTTGGFGNFIWIILLTSMSGSGGSSGLGGIDMILLLLVLSGENSIF